MHACLRLPTTEIKADIDFITKNKKQKLFATFLVCCALFFLQKIYI